MFGLCTNSLRLGRKWTEIGVRLRGHRQALRTAGKIEAVRVRQLRSYCAHSAQYQLGEGRFHHSVCRAACRLRQGSDGLRCCRHPNTRRSPVPIAGVQPITGVARRTRTCSRPPALVTLNKPTGTPTTRHSGLGSISSVRTMYEHQWTSPKG